MTKMWPSVKEGWGITQDPQSKVLYVSDGTAHLTKIDGETLHELGQLTVTHKGQALAGMNELEFINGLIWGNIYMHNILVAVDPTSGKIVHTVDCTGLHAKENEYRSFNGIEPLWRYNNEFNGIAWDADT